jgi:hypothetical protein
LIATIPVSGSPSSTSGNIVITAGNVTSNVINSTKTSRPSTFGVVATGSPIALTADPPALTAAMLTVTWPSDDALVYDGANKTTLFDGSSAPVGNVVVAATGTKTGLTVSFFDATGATAVTPAPKDAGTYTVKIVGSGVPNVGNATVTLEKKLVITKRPLGFSDVEAIHTVTAKVYDGQTNGAITAVEFTNVATDDQSAFTANASNAIYEIGAATWSGSAANPTGGAYNVSATVILSVATAANYTLGGGDNKSAVLTARGYRITRRPVTVVVTKTVYSKTYDGTTDAPFTGTPTLTHSAAGEITFTWGSNKIALTNFVEAEIGAAPVRTDFSYTPTGAKLESADATLANPGLDLELPALTGGLGGSKGGNYTISTVQTATKKGAIAKKTLFFTSSTFHNRAYSTTENVTWGTPGTPSISGTTLKLPYTDGTTSSSEIVLVGIATPDAGKASDFASTPAPTAKLASVDAGTVDLVVSAISLPNAGVGKNYTVEDIGGSPDVPSTVRNAVTNGAGATAVTVRQVGSAATITKYSDSLKVTGQVAPSTADSTIVWTLIDTLGIAEIARERSYATLKTGIDTVVIRATGKGNGTVRLRGKSGVNQSFGELSIVISGQRTAPTALRVLTGIKKGTEGDGQAVLTWTATPAVGGTISGYRVSSGAGPISASSNTSHTIDGLSLNGKYTFSVKAVYADGTEGPEAAVRDSIPAERTQILGSQIILASTAKTFNGSAQDLGRATTTTSNLTSGGADVFDTLYEYAGTARDGSSYDGGEPARYALAKPPTKAGVYTVTVTFQNSRFSGFKVVSYTINPKNLTNAMLTIPTITPAYVYDGTAKEPPYDVKDGTAQLALGSDYTSTDNTNPDNVWVSNTNAGVASVILAGIGNYTSTATKTFNIGKKTIQIDTVSANQVAITKVYNGKADIDTAVNTELEVKFTGTIGGQVLEHLVDYVTTNAKFTGSANISTPVANPTVNVAVTAGVTLLNSAKAANYALATSPTFRTTGVIVKKTPTVEDGDTSFAFTIPTTHLYTGTARGIGAVTFKAPLADPTCTLTVLYAVDGVDTTLAPAAAGTYPVKVQVKPAANGLSNFNEATVTLGEYVIGDPLKPEIVTDTTFKAVTVRQGDAYRLTVDAKSPNSGTLSYRWYRNDTLITGANAASYTPPTTVVGSENQYYVWITNTVRDVQAPDSIQSATATISVLPPAKSLSGATVQISADEFVYNGAAQVPGEIVVSLGADVLALGVDYTLAITQNTNAGRALVTVTGVDAYKDEAIGSFTIARKALEREDFSFASTRVYNAAPQALEVITLADPTTGNARDGLGRATITYNGSATAPTEAGYYKISISFVQGTNFTASEEAFVEDSAYVISQRLPTKADLNYAEIEEGRAFPYDSTVTRGIGTATLKGTKGGEVTVLYNGKEDLPKAVGTYIVTAEVEGGDNYLYNIVSLGSFDIYDPSAVKGNDRVIPGSGSEVVVVAPVQVVAGEFTVGPNPVAKASGKAGFFWQGKALAKGTLYVFDASGNLVKKVAVSDKGISTARREIGAWDIGVVAEGTYLVKGVLVGKDGVKVKVSSLVGVR